jgi:hypothetical protein
MELSSLSENIVTRTFKRSGESVTLKINLDAIVPDYAAEMDARLEPLSKRMETFVRQHAELQAEIEALQKKEEAKDDDQPSEPIDFILYAGRLKEIRQGLAEVKRELFAERLTCPVLLPDGSTTCILKGWDVTQNGMSAPPTKANLMQLTSAAVEALFDFIMEETEVVKKREDEATEATSEATRSGLRAVSPETTLAQTG